MKRDSIVLSVGSGISNFVFEKYYENFLKNRERINNLFDGVVK